jgi:hypothetical protein
MLSFQNYGKIGYLRDGIFYTSLRDTSRRHFRDAPSDRGAAQLKSLVPLTCAPFKQFRLDYVQGFL